MRRLLLIAMLTGAAGKLMMIAISYYNLFSDHRVLTGVFATIIYALLTALSYIGIMIAKGVSERSKRLIRLGIIFGCLACVASYFLSFILPSIESVMALTSNSSPESLMNDIPMHGSTEEVPPELHFPTALEIVYSFIEIIIIYSPVGFFAAGLKRKADFKESSIIIVAVAGIIATLIGFAGRYLGVIVISIIIYTPIFNLLPEGETLQQITTFTFPIISVISTLLSAALGSAGIWFGVEWTYSRILDKPDSAS